MNPRETKYLHTMGEWLDSNVVPSDLIRHMPYDLVVDIHRVLRLERALPGFQFVGCRDLMKVKSSWSQAETEEYQEAAEEAEKVKGAVYIYKPTWHFCVALKFMGRWAIKVMGIALDEEER